MSRQTKDELIDELTFEVRAAQSAVDQMDDAAARALGINRTDGRCLDVIDREGPVAEGAAAPARALGITPTGGRARAVTDREAPVAAARLAAASGLTTAAV